MSLRLTTNILHGSSHARPGFPFAEKLLELCAGNLQIKGIYHVYLSCHSRIYNIGKSFQQNQEKESMILRVVKF